MDPRERGGPIQVLLAITELGMQLITHIALAPAPGAGASVLI